MFVPRRGEGEQDWYCLFCRHVIHGPMLNGEVAYWADDRGSDPEYTTFAAHPRCFMDATHQSIRDEGYFDAVTFLPRMPPTG